MGKGAEVRQRDQFGFHAAHRKSGHGTIRLITESTEVGINVRDQLIDEQGLKWTDVKVSQTTELDFVGQAIGHHDDERLRFLLGQQIIHDQAGMPLHAPTVFVFAPAVLEIEDRVSLVCLLFIIRRRVNKRTAVGVSTSGIEQNFADLTVRYILYGVKVAVVRRNFNGTPPSDWLRRSTCCSGQGLRHRQS